MMNEKCYAKNPKCLLNYKHSTFPIVASKIVEHHVLSSQKPKLLLTGIKPIVIAAANTIEAPTQWGWEKPWKRGKIESSWSGQWSFGFKGNGSLWSTEFLVVNSLIFCSVDETNENVAKKIKHAIVRGRNDDQRTDMTGTETVVHPKNIIETRTENETATMIDEINTMIATGKMTNEQNQMQLLSVLFFQTRSPKSRAWPKVIQRRWSKSKPWEIKIAREITWLY